jgi:hypothetical protein
LDFVDFQIQSRHYAPIAGNDFGRTVDVEYFSGGVCVVGCGWDVVLSIDGEAGEGNFRRIGSKTKYPKPLKGILG